MFVDLIYTIPVPVFAECFVEVTERKRLLITLLEDDI